MHLHKLATLQAAAPQLQMRWGVPQTGRCLPQRQSCRGVLWGAVPLPHSCGQIAHGSCVALQCEPGDEIPESRLHSVACATYITGDEGSPSL